MSVSKEHYEQAVLDKTRAEQVINAYHAQKQDEFEKRWEDYEQGRRFFVDDELRYSAGAKCDTCGAGLAYPESCGMHHRWDCSRVLKGETKQEEDDGKIHHSYPFAFYEIKSEGQPSAQGATTRPGGKAKPIK